MTPARPVLTRRGAGLAMVLTLASCASPNPALYILEASPGPTRRGGPKVIEVRNVGLARYLERSQIVILRRR